ncbi:MAG: hypothetical protein WAK26_02495, partial [Terracidiphilus sp.]
MKEARFQLYIVTIAIYQVQNSSLETINLVCFCIAHVQGYHSSRSSRITNPVLVKVRAKKIAEYFLFIALNFSHDAHSFPYFLVEQILHLLDETRRRW